jgi:predicted AAA+ superfamily ATPase
LAVHLLDITTPSQIARDPLLGGLFENMVVIEALKAQYNKGMRAGLYYIRGKNGVEIDIVVEKARRLHGIEIKSSKTPDDSFVANMKKFSTNVASLESQSVIYSGDDWPISGGGRFINFRDTGGVIDEI